MSNTVDEPMVATKGVLKSIDTLSNSLRTSAATNSNTVLNNLNTYITQLQKLSAAGNATSFPLSTDVLRFLDEGDISNPWLYMHKEFEDCENVAADFGERKCFLEELRENIEQELLTDSKKALGKKDESETLSN